MSTNRHLSLARYTYDPLDRLVNCTPSDQPYIQRFYCKTHLCTEIQGVVHRSIVQHEDQLLAQYLREGTEVTTTLLATDLQRSVLYALHGKPSLGLAYTPYGHRPLSNDLLSLLGFNGEQPDPITAHYHLGNGYRQFNPVLMRFNNPDSLSPFGDGGLNAYAYCAGDPRNQSDPTGHAPVRLDRLFLRKAPRISGTPQSTLRPSTLAGAVNPQATSSAATSTSISSGRTTVFSVSRDPIVNPDTLAFNFGAQQRPQPNMLPPPDAIDLALFANRPLNHIFVRGLFGRLATRLNPNVMIDRYPNILSTPIQAPSSGATRWKAVAYQTGVRRA